MGSFTTMTSKGQITIPSDVRDELQLLPGTRFYVAARDGQVVAIPRNKKLMDFAGILGKPPTGENLTVEEMRDAIGQAAADDDARIMGEPTERDG
ncbi:AbrB/MazE/SpoVT family DNA-binding domain-containing protein [Neorhizobium sp. NCHU2750]|uniref:AbrB/MazE/SpoVT family DNA-binding domain-containing protein n=1 Tax=Neorhizobium sp. NCHU2750 TaxID=1825976 RepID=UPI000E72AFCD|nr:AbrB family transcriptional regulator [Neorhizobium sp. NCHU2750]